MSREISYSVAPTGIDQDTAARATALVRRHVPDLDGQAEVLAMLGLAAGREPPPPPGTLWTTADIARRAGLSRDRVRQLVHTPGWPPPAGTLDGARAWDAHDIEQWITEHRPATDTQETA